MFKYCGRSIHGDRTRRRVLNSATSPESRLEHCDRAEPHSTTPHRPLIPATGQRGRSPGHAAARVLPAGFAAEMPTICSYTRREGFVDARSLATLSQSGRKRDQHLYS